MNAQRNRRHTGGRDRSQTRDPNKDRRQEQRSLDASHALTMLATRSLSIEPLTDDAQYGALPAGLIESIRHLINSRELSGEASLSNRIAVTSSVRGEGSTTVSHALASLIASDFDSWVCWVDLSWAKVGAPPRPTGRPGIFDLIDGRAEPQDVIRFSPELGVAVLGAGTVPRDGRNVGRSADLEEVVTFLSEEFDHLVFDMPPVLESTAGLPLFRFAEDYLMVCKSRVTRAEQLERTTARLAELSLIGTVLNEQSIKMPRFLQRMLIG